LATEQQLKQLKQELLSQKDQLERSMNNTGIEMNQRNQRENVGELSNYDNHPADMGTELYEREKDMALGIHAASELYKVNQALKAMDNGTYGTCAECGKEIPFERLEILPSTLYCVDHSKDQTTPSDRPVEEKLLEPPHTDSFARRRNWYIVDHEDSFQDVARYGTSETPSDYTGNHSDYGSLYHDEDELEGFTEQIESFVGNDMQGKNRKVYRTKSHEEYEELLDLEDTESMIGNIPYTESDGYVE
jgi:YteA family regulatory protein